MGSGSSRKRTVTRHTQVTSPPNPRVRSPSPQLTTRTTHHHKRRYSSSPKLHIHRLQSNSSLANYANIWERDGKLSSAFEQLIRSESTIKVEHEQKEIKTDKNTTTHSSTYQTAQVDSTLTSEIESIHSLSTSERIDTLILNLKQAHADFDESVKRRIGRITNETESILSQIVEETQKNQQHLLTMAKEQQTIQDEQYRILLEDFVQRLDEKRARQLAFIQEQLQEQRLEIFNQSQLKIRALTEQANSLKTEIMSQEEKIASKTIDSIINEINSISTESAIQDIATEIKTNINLTVTETVGSNNTSTQYDRQLNRQHITRKTTFLENNNQLTRSASNRSIHKLPK